MYPLCWAAEFHGRNPSGYQWDYSFLLMFIIFMVAQTNSGSKFLKDALEDTYVPSVTLGSKCLIYFFKAHE